MDQDRPDRRDALAISALLAAALLAGYSFVYRGGMSEPDSVVMAAGMARMAAGAPLSECMLYGRFLNPGIYLLFRVLQPLFAVSPGGTIDFLNTIGVLSWSLLPPLFYLLLRRRSGRTVFQVSRRARGAGDTGARSCRLTGRYTGMLSTGSPALQARPDTKATRPPVSPCTDSRRRGPRFTYSFQAGFRWADGMIQPVTWI